MTEHRRATSSTPHESPPDSLAKRLGWFVLLWVGGVVVVTVVAYSIRLMILP